MAIKLSQGLLSSLGAAGGAQQDARQPMGSGLLQPALSSNPLVNTLVKSIGQARGMDMRTPEEKILAATAGVDRTTAAGQLEAIEARLQFETDPDKRNTLGQQAVQLRRQMASDATAKATAERTAKEDRDLATLNTRAEPILREAGYLELADMAASGSLTQPQIQQNLGNIRKDKITLERNQGDLSQAILNTPELEGTEAYKQALQGKVPNIAPRFQLAYMEGLREEAEQDRFLTTLKARKGGQRIATDLEEGLTTFTEAQKQAADLGNVTYGDVKFYKVGNEILPTRERKQQDGTKDVVTWSPVLNKYVEVDETRLEKVPTERQPKTPRVVSPVSKNQRTEVLSAFEFEENTTDKPGQPFSNKEKLNEFDSDRKKRVLRDIANRAAQLKAQNPGTTFSQHIQPAIEEVMSRVEFTESAFGDTVEYRAAPVIKEWTAE
jgi:hypothetical protein